MANSEVPNFTINHSCCNEIKAFYSLCKGAKRIHVNGMEEYLDLEAKSLNSGDSSEEEGTNNVDVGVGEAPDVPSSGDKNTRSPLPKHHRKLGLN